MPPAAMTLSPNQVADLLGQDRAVMIDIREPDEFARRHIKGARSQPLSALSAVPLNVPHGKTVVFTCKSGMRTAANCERLVSGLDRAAFLLEGGVDGWAAAGLPVTENRKAPLEMMRQVQIGAGSLVLLGVALGYGVHPVFFGLSGAVGAGLLMAGVTGFCGLARLLNLAPWNRAAGT
ncbi:MAG: rhodanese family protein [Phenylobacterium sp.]|uniref:rhodanese family protein n=1 Tax=Phenylobacterium sp. TaxID=1871053 RepID=UPI0027352D61|nr:rhodanese family protein [Phenylobacterium sp.]MDP3747543.1 rhodanese family protein [Phenylobacterium sp.]